MSVNLAGGQRVLQSLKGFDTRRIILVVTTALLLALVAYPAWLLFLKSLPVDNYVEQASHPLTRRALLNTLYVAVAITILTTSVGVVMALLLTRTDLPLKRVLRGLVYLTFITPAYLGAIAWIQLLGRSGYFNTLLRDAFNLETLPIDLYTLEGVIAIMSIHIYPLVFMATANALNVTDPSLEEAAVTSGASPRRVLFTVTLPLALPGILSGAVLAFIQGIACFGVAAAIAMPTGHFVLTTRIYAALGHYDVRMACAMSVALILLTAVSLFVHNALLRGKRYTVTTSESRRRRFISLGRWRFPVAAVLLLFFATTTLLPLATILLTSFLKAWGLAPTPENLTLGNYAKVVTEDLASRALRNSLVFASTGATLAALLGLIVAYISVRTRMVGRKVIDFLATMPSAIPGPVLAAAMIFAWMNPPVSLYNTPWIIIVAYVTAFLPYAMRNVAGVLEGMDPTLEEMGWASGASWARTMRNITVPLIGRGLWAGWILVFLMAFREIALSTMLYTQGTETVGAVLFMLKSETGGLEVVSAMSVVVMVITIAGQLLVEKLGIMRRSGAL